MRGRKLILLLTIAVFLATGVIGCKQSLNQGNTKPPLARCMEDLKSIPELSALKAREKEDAPSGSLPLEGFEVAFTLNDMVRGEGLSDVERDDWCDKENSRANFDKLVAALKQNGLPSTVDFAIGQTLDSQLANAWVAAGNVLGSMTFSRKKPNKTSADDFISDLARNDQALASYWKIAPPSPTKYFRFPKFKLNSDAQDRAKIEKYLAGAGYTIVPATIDAHDEKFSWIYCAAVGRGDTSCLNLIKAYFKSLLLDTTSKARESARQIAGREVKHILVFKANQFTCDNLAELLGWYKSLGAKFIPLADALADPFYKMVDEEGRPAGIKVIRTVKTAQQGDKEK